MVMFVNFYVEVKDFIWYSIGKSKKRLYNVDANPVYSYSHGCASSRASTFECELTGFAKGLYRNGDYLSQAAFITALCRTYCAGHFILERIWGFEKNRRCAAEREPFI
jgi:hypothetical protein